MKSKNSKIFKIAKYISNNPGCSRNQANLAVLNDGRPGYHNTTYGTLMSREIIECVKSKLEGCGRLRGYYITDHGLSVMNNMPANPDGFLEGADQAILNKGINNLSDTDIEVLKKISFSRIPRNQILSMGVDRETLTDLVRLNLSYCDEMDFYTTPVNNRQVVLDLI